MTIKIRSSVTPLLGSDRITAELQQVQSSHSAKLEQLNSQHQIQLAQALETQRRSMEGDKLTAMEKLELSWKARLSEALADFESSEGKLDKLRLELHESQENTHHEKLRSQELESEIAALKRLHQEQLDNQQNLIEEKHQSLMAAQSAQRQLTRSIEQQLSNQS